MTHAAPPVLNASGISIGYGSGQATLRDISLDVREGETVALIGANGAGKSTLLRALVGQQRVSAGCVTTFGQRFETLPSSRQAQVIRRQIGFVFQSHALVSRLSALSNTVHGLLGLPGAWRAWHQALASDAIRVKALAALGSVGLGDRATSRVDQLSGGQAQRVAIARAVVREPRLLLADEPAASLDPAAGEAIMQAFVQLARECGMTLLFTTHDMEHALAYADRVVALRAGRVALDRPSAAIAASELRALFDG